VPSVNERSYHHGDLRRALLDAAVELIDERGLERATLREITRRAGVSHAAPYHHFPDRVALLEAAAAESFEQLAAHLRHADHRARGDGAAHVRAVFVAYARFALEHRARWRLLIEPDLVTGPAGSDVMNAALEVQDAVATSVRAAIGDGTVRADLDPDTIAVAAWSNMHGLTTLAIGGLLGDTFTPSRADRAARAAADAFLEGIRS
jgi:AcrR family transcriptional regulator